MFERLRWRLWRFVIKRPNVCPTSAHSVIVWGNRDQSIKIGPMCHRDADRNGSCWCGKLQPFAAGAQ